jgi:tetraacyldisaccharide 4'-kinase
MGDEPYMLSKKLGDIPVIVDADRARGAKKAGRDFAADTLILDDGFQQWKIEKNLEIVCVDARNPFGNRRLLPRGILREPLSALKRAQIFVLTKTNLNPQTEAAANLLRKINPQALVCTAIHNPAGFYNLNKPAPLLALDSLRSQTVASICGIADPAGFEDLIASLGIKAGLTFRFPDHHQYTQDDLAKVMRACQEKNINAIITTEKDAAKFYQLPITDYQLPIFVLCIEIKITGNEQEFHRRLLSLYSG